MAFIDITGQRFSRLLVISFSHMAPNRKGSVWNCVCDCGTQKKVAGSLLRAGQSKSCGCLQREITSNRIPTNFIDISGLVFGRLTVIERGDKGKGHSTNWVCRCECGTYKVVAKNNLLSGRQLSCGCHNREVASKNKTTHGRSKDKLYRVWSGIVTRCYNSSHGSYKNYGGRGIIMSSSWKNDFMVFYNDMKSGYSKGLQIDRIDNNGNYCKENCRWVSSSDNGRNKRNTIYLSIDGVTKTMAEWAEITGQSYHKLHKRKSKGKTDKIILFGDK